MDYNEIISKNMNRHNELRDSLSQIRQMHDDGVASDILDKYNQGVEHMAEIGGGVGALSMGVHSLRKAYKARKGATKEDKLDKDKTPEEEDTTPQKDPATQSGEEKPEEPAEGEQAVTAEPKQPLFRDVARSDKMKDLDDSGTSPTSEDVSKYDSVDDIFENKPDSMFKKYSDNLAERSKNPNFTSDQNNELNDLLQKQATERNQLSGSDEWASMTDDAAKQRFATLKTNQASEYDAKLKSFESGDSQGQPQPDDSTQPKPAGDEADKPPTVDAEEPPVEGPLPKDAPPGSDEASNVFDAAAPEVEETATETMGALSGALDLIPGIGEIAGAALGIASLIEALEPHPSKEDLEKQAFRASAPASQSVGVDVAKAQPHAIVGSLL